MGEGFEDVLLMVLMGIGAVVSFLSLNRKRKKSSIEEETPIEKGVDPFEERAREIYKEQKR